MANKKSNPAVILIALIIVAAAAYYFVLADKTKEVPEGAYVDSKSRYCIIPPTGWGEIDKSSLESAAEGMLPDSVKRIVRGSRADVVFMNTEDPALVGSNMNIMYMTQGAGLELDEKSFNQLKIQNYNLKEISYNPVHRFQ